MITFCFSSVTLPKQNVNWDIDLYNSDSCVKSAYLEVASGYRGDRSVRQIGACWYVFLFLTLWENSMYFRCKGIHPLHVFVLDVAHCSVASEHRTLCVLWFTLLYEGSILEKKNRFWHFFVCPWYLFEKNVTILGILCRFQTFICDRGDCDCMPGVKKLLFLS